MGAGFSPFFSLRCEVQSESSSVLSFDLNVDLHDLDLQFAEKISGEDWEEVWQPRKAKEKEEEPEPLSPVPRGEQKCRCVLQ